MTCLARQVSLRKVALLCSRIYCICHYSTKLREVITRDLLPSSTMIKHLSQEFGLPVSLEELIDEEKLLATPPQPTSTHDLQSQKFTLNTEILAHQEKYLQWRNRVMKKRYGTRNLIQVGTLSALQSGVPGLGPTWAVQSHVGRRRAGGHSPNGASASGCTDSPALESQGGWARCARCRAGPPQRHSLIAWHTPSS